LRPESYAPSVAASPWTWPFIHKNVSDWFYKQGVTSSPYDIQKPSQKHKILTSEGRRFSWHFLAAKTDSEGGIDGCGFVDLFFLMGVVSSKT
jgi:hypothetical protein